VSLQLRRMASRCHVGTDLEVLELDAREALVAALTLLALAAGVDPVQHALEHAPRTRRDCLLRLRVEIRDEEERAVALIRQAAERGQVNLGVQIVVAVRLVADEELARIDGVVEIPAKDDRAL